MSFVFHKESNLSLIILAHHLLDGRVFFAQNMLFLREFCESTKKEKTSILREALLSLVNTPILIYKNVFDFIFEFEIFIKLNGNEITTYNGNILI